MATSNIKPIRQAEHVVEDMSEHMSSQIAALRRQLAAVSSSLEEMRESMNAHEFRDEVAHRARAAARYVGHQANSAGNVGRENPLQTAAALTAVALLAALVFRRD